jgi:hypothetical protein
MARTDTLKLTDAHVSSVLGSTTLDAPEVAAVLRQIISAQAGRSAAVAATNRARALAAQQALDEAVLKVLRTPLGPLVTAHGAPARIQTRLRIAVRHGTLSSTYGGEYEPGLPAIRRSMQRLEIARNIAPPELGEHPGSIASLYASTSPST